MRIEDDIADTLAEENLKLVRHILTDNQLGILIQDAIIAAREDLPLDASGPQRVRAIRNQMCKLAPKSLAQAPKV